MPFHVTQEQIITFVGGGIVVFVAEQAISYFRRERRILAYTVDTQMIAEKSHDQLKLQYQGIEVQRLHLQKVFLKNAGNTAIAKLPVYIKTPPSKAMFASITADKPGIHCTILEDEKVFAFECDLLNPKDTITVDFTLLDAEHTSISVDARSEKLVVKEVSREGALRDVLDLTVANTSGLTWVALKLAQKITK